MARIPADRLMIESDAPYLLPRTLKPRASTRRNEPAYLVEVARTVAGARQQEYPEFAGTSTAAAVRFFGLPGND